MNFKLHTKTVYCVQQKNVAIFKLHLVFVWYSKLVRMVRFGSVFQSMECLKYLKVKIYTVKILLVTH